MMGIGKGFFWNFQKLFCVVYVKDLIFYCLCSFLLIVGCLVVFYIGNDCVFIMDSVFVM